MQNLFWRFELRKKCKRCGVITPYDRTDKNAGKYVAWTEDHKCNYKFWRRIEEFGECVKG